MTASGPGADRRRLHPLTPLLRGARALAAVVAAVSWRGYADLGPARWLAAIAAVGAVAVAVSVVSWAVTGYQITGRELRVQDGLLWRRTRVIPLERIQAIEVRQSVPARLTGLAELRIEVIGGNDTEGRLAFLARDEATALRQRLLVLAADVTSAGAAGTVGDEPSRADPDADEVPVHAVRNRDVLLGQLMTIATWTVPFWLAAAALPAVTESDWSFIGTASTLTALLGVVWAPVRRVFSDWDFRVSTDPAGLRLRHGLLETRSQSVPVHRVQTVAVVRPLLWRPFGWHRARIDVAGYGTAQAGIRAGVLLPIADEATTHRVVGLVLARATGTPGTPDGPGSPDGAAVPPVGVPLVGVPRRARWLAPLAMPVLGFAVTDRTAVTRRGVLTRELTVTPLARIQSVRVVQGPLQRRLRLASVHVDTAGGGLRVVGEHRDADEAYALAETLAVRARAERARTRAERLRAKPGGPAAG